MIDVIEERLYHPDNYPNHGIDVRLDEYDLLTLKYQNDDKRFRRTDVLERLSSCSSYT